MAITSGTPRPTLQVTENTSLQQLTDFADSLGTDVSRLRGTKNEDGSITLYGGGERANFSDRITGQAKQHSANAREAIRDVIGRSFDEGSEVKADIFAYMARTDSGRSLSAEPLKTIVTYANNAQAAASFLEREPQIESLLAPVIDSLSVDSIANLAKSPTLVDQLKSLETDGWTIKEETEEGYESAGYCSQSTQEIGMGPLLLEDTVQFLQTLAHETGHAYNNLPEDPSTRDLYVASQLKDEGGATYNNIKVQREILAAGGIDIGIAGAGAEEYNATYDRLVEGRDPSEIVLDDVFVALGANFGTAEESSVPIDRGQGNEYVNYQTYYEHQYSQI